MAEIVIILIGLITGYSYGRSSGYQDGQTDMQEKIGEMQTEIRDLSNRLWLAKNKK